MAKYAFVLNYKLNMLEKDYEFVHKFFNAYGFVPFQNILPNIFVAEKDGLDPIISIVGRIPHSITRHLDGNYCVRMTDISENYIGIIGNK